MSYRTEELLAVCISRLIRAVPTHHIAVGAASPIPAAACWLNVKQGEKLHLSLLHKRTGNPFTEGSRELFDLNLIGTGDWPGMEVRFPGSFGSAFMYFMAGRTILFREEHSPRVLVDKVAHISAPGISEPGVYRRGHAQALVTSRCVFHFHPEQGRFSLASMHAGETLESIRAMTGFDFDVPEGVGETPAPSEAELALLRGPVCDEMMETYPEFCSRVFGRARAA